MTRTSHPTRVRGLKLVLSSSDLSYRVAPYTGAWIEMCIRARLSFSPLSHPTRVRGLKFESQTAKIETNGRTLHGCVD